MLRQIKVQGFNSIRIPFSLEALESSTTSGIDFGGGRNAALQGKTPQQVMDIIIDEAGAQGLMVILDNHSLADDGFPEESLEEIQNLINAEDTDLFDVLEYVAFAKQPISRIERVMATRPELQQARAPNRLTSFTSCWIDTSHQVSTNSTPTNFRCCCS